MNVTKIILEVSNIAILIDGVDYKKQVCDIEVNYRLLPGACLNARSKKPFFVMGLSFWDEVFGKRQANKIKRLCKDAAKKFMKENKISSAVE